MVLLDFYATWCEPCKWSEPVIESVMTELNGLVRLEKVDIDQQPERAKNHAVLSVPTFILIDGGREVWRMNGFDTSSKMVAAIREAINKQNA